MRLGLMLTHFCEQEIMNGKPGNLPRIAMCTGWPSDLFAACALDTMKGSYYANPVLDEPNVSPKLHEAYPEYYGKNICMRF